MPQQSVSDGRRRGRQEEARRNDARLLAAARLVFALDGPGAAVSAIAAEAGVGIASLYRRYPSKEVLLEHLCGASLDQQIGAAEAALASDGSGLFDFIRAAVGFRAGVFSSLAGSIEPTPSLTRLAADAHELTERLVAEAQMSGHLRQDVTATDVHALIELFSRRRREGDYERLLAVMLDGLRPSGRAPLPGAAETWKDRYARPWGAGR